MRVRLPNASVNLRDLCGKKGSSRNSGMIRMPPRRNVGLPGEPFPRIREETAIGCRRLAPRGVGCSQSPSAGSARPARSASAFGRCADVRPLRDDRVSSLARYVTGSSAFPNGDADRAGALRALADFADRLRLSQPAITPGGQGDREAPKARRRRTRRRRRRTQKTTRALPFLRPSASFCAFCVSLVLAHHEICDRMSK